METRPRPKVGLPAGQAATKRHHAGWVIDCDSCGQQIPTALDYISCHQTSPPTPLPILSPLGHLGRDAQKGRSVVRHIKTSNVGSRGFSHKLHIYTQDATRELRIEDMEDIEDG